ncbi:hypothetical protein D3C73_1238980 [compost metagenome]
MLLQRAQAERRRRMGARSEGHAGIKLDDLLSRISRCIFFPGRLNSQALRHTQRLEVCLPGMGPFFLIYCLPGDQRFAGINPELAQLFHTRRNFLNYFVHGNSLVIITFNHGFTDRDIIQRLVV